MQWDTIDVLIRQHLGPGIILGGLIVISLVLFATLLAKDLRLSVYIFLLAVTFTGVQNDAIHTVLYLLRWLILALITVRIISGQSRIRFSTTSFIFLIWVVLAFISGLQAPSVFRGVVFATVYGLSFLVFFLLFLNEVSTEEGMNKWFNMFLLLAWTFVMISIVSFLVEPSVYARGHGGRLTGIFANSASKARTLLFAASFFLWYGLKMKGNLPKQFLYYAMTIISLALMLLAGSRGAIAAFAIMTMILAFRYRAKMVGLVLPVIIIAALVIVPKILSSSSKQFTEHLVSLETSYRPMLRELGVQRFTEHPIRGWGLGSLSDIRADVCPDFVSLHNVYLNWVVEFGLPGFCVIMYLLFYCYIRLWRFVLGPIALGYTKDVAWFLLAWFTALIVWGYLDTSIGDPSKLYFYWFFILMVLSEAVVYIANNSYQELALDSDLDYIYEEGDRV